MKIDKILSFGIAIMLSACSAYETPQEQQAPGTLAFTTSVEDFEGASRTRTNIAGNAFENGDKIKLKIICPFSANTEHGETTDGNSFDAFWLLKWNSNQWTTLTAQDGYDINGDYSPSASPDIYGRYLAQQTPYVFTAQTWSEEQIFIAGGGTRVEQYSHVFHADQSKAENYKASDLMWAQTILQTGSYSVHLSFKHVMAALLVTIDGNISDHAVLTLEGMPAIDQAEVIVGDYYAKQSKINSNAYGYKAKHQCGVDNNGKVIGIAVVDDSNNKALTKSLSDIAQTATYTAYNAGGKTEGGNTYRLYRLIVPPCKLTNKATFWLRDGEKRYSMPLDQATFEGGKLYKVKMKIGQ